MLNQPVTRVGFVLALLSAATFGTSGTFASALIDAGWSPGAAVTVRISVAAVLLAIPAVVLLRGRWQVLWRNAGMVAIYGLVAVAGCQVAYFNAVQHLSVGVALLLEYMGIVLIVGWLWLRTGKPPRRLTIAGSVAAVLGLVLVLDLTGETRIDLVGVLWGLAAAVGLALFFILSASSDGELPPVAMASGGMTVGAMALLILGAFGALPMAANTDDVDFAGHQVSWLVPVIGLSLVAAALAYVLGISATRRTRLEAGVVRRADRGALRGAVRLAAARRAAHRHAAGGRRVHRARGRAGPGRRTAHPTGATAAGRQSATRCRNSLMWLTRPAGSSEIGTWLRPGISLSSACAISGR